MMVKVEIELQSKAEQSDKEDMFCAAKTLTNSLNSITITQANSKDSVLIATFTIHKARQIDVVEKIARSFSDTMKNYGHPSISFPKDRIAKNVSEPRNDFTKKQGQYLSFIYYYTKLNRGSTC